MMHLNDDRLLELAEKIQEERPFDDGDIAAMEHIAACNVCYELLCCMMAAREVSEHPGDFVPATAAVPLGELLAERVTATFRLVVDELRSALKAVESLGSDWLFEPALPLGARGGNALCSSVSSGFGAGFDGFGEEADGGAKKLEDIDNPDNFLAYDERTHSLQLQLDAKDAPEAYLRRPDGTLKPIALKKRGGKLFGELPELSEGEYEIILKK